MQEIIDFRVRPRFPETLKAWTPVPTAAMAPYVDLYKMESRLSFLTVDEQLAEMDRHGIAVAVLSGGNRHENRFIAELCARHPDRFVGLGGVQPQEGATRAYRDAREALEELGLAGINLVPCVLGIPADDPRNTPCTPCVTTWASWRSSTRPCITCPTLPSSWATRATSTRSPSTSPP